MSAVLVVYETMFGANRQVAEAVAEGLAEVGPVEVVEVSDAPVRLPDDLRLLVVGGPNHAAHLPKPATRESAAEMLTEAGGEPALVHGPGLREWLPTLSVERGSVLGAAWDTRIDHPGFLQHIDRASTQIARGLAKAGFEVLVPHVHVRVGDRVGPLPGELDRAHDWARAISSQLPTPTSRS